MVISISSLVQSCDTHDQGEVVKGAVLSALRGNSTVVVSFSGIGTATSSFVNVAFVELLKSLSIGDLKSRIKFVDSTRQINDMIKHCLLSVANRAKMVA